MEQGGSFCARRVDRRAGHVLGIQLEHLAHWPAAMAQGARVLQTVSSATEPRELEPGSGHPAGQERNGTPEPITRMLAGNTGAQQWAPVECPSSASALHMSAFGGKADMPFCTAHVRF